MNATGAVVFLPREGNGPSLMLEELLFDPAALWLAESLRAAGVERFFVVCHTDDQARAAACFPAGTEFVTGGSGDAVEQLSAFLNALEGKVIVITKPVLLDWGDARTLAGLENGGVLDSKDTGVYRIDGGLLSQTLAEGVGLEEALKEKGDRFNSRGVWFQGAYPIRSGWNGRMEAEMVARQHGVRRLLEAGVRIMDPSHCYVGPRVKVGEGTVLLPGTILRGETKIGAGSVIGPNSLLENVTVGENVKFNASQGYDSVIESGAAIGPFAHIRPDSRVCENVHIGDFVEIKNSTVGKGTSVSHLTYVGDSDVGKYCNFGCGVVTVNYDGAAKHRNTIGDYAFIGCNTNLVAPVSVGDGAYTAAGSTITDDVPAGALGIARARQVNKPQWAKGKLEKFIAKQQAKEEAGSK